MKATKEDVYRGALGALEAGYSLPVEDGNLAGFKVVEIEAEQGDKVYKIINKILISLEHVPERLLLHRSKQLSI